MSVTFTVAVLGTKDATIKVVDLNNSGAVQEKYIDDKKSDTFTVESDSASNDQATIRFFAKERAAAEYNRLSAHDHPHHDQTIEIRDADLET